MDGKVFLVKCYVTIGYQYVVNSGDKKLKHLSKKRA